MYAWYKKKWVKVSQIVNTNKKTETENLKTTVELPYKYHGRQSIGKPNVPLTWPRKCIPLPWGNQSRQWLFRSPPGSSWGGEQICTPHRSGSRCPSGTACRPLTSAILCLWQGPRSRPWCSSAGDSARFRQMMKSIQVPMILKLLLWKTPHVRLKVSDKLLSEVQPRKWWGRDLSAVSYSSINMPHLKTAGRSRSTRSVISGCKRPSLLTDLQTQLFLIKWLQDHGTPWENIQFWCSPLLTVLENKPPRRSDLGRISPSSQPSQILKSSSWQSQTIEVSSSTVRSG